MSSLIRNTIILLVIVAFVLCLPDCAWAGSFDGLNASGAKIFRGLRKIIYPASAIGIICVCIGGFFGNINWKWLTVIVIGLLVVSVCAAFIGMFSPDGAQPDLG